MGQHSSASASRLLGLDGFAVLAADIAGGEWRLEVQTTATVVGCQGCGVRTWTERTAAIRPRAVLTERARAEACRRVGKDAHAVAAVARDLGSGGRR